MMFATNRSARGGTRESNRNTRQHGSLAKRSVWAGFPWQPALNARKLATADTNSSDWLGGTDALICALLADAMRQLPVEQRAVITRAYCQRWTTARIADDLNLTEDTVISQLHYGLHELRLRLREVEMTSAWMP